MTRIYIFLLASASYYNCAFTLYAQAPRKKAATKVTLPAIAAIRPSELQADLFEISDDRFRGREAGTVDELKASAWLAEKARLAGLVPAGDNGTFFQFFNLKRHRIAPASSVKVGDRQFQLWKDVLVTQTAPAQINVPLFFANSLELSQIDTASIRGRAVVIFASTRDIDLDITRPERRYPTLLFRKYSPTLINNGAAAIIFIADSLGEKSWPAVLPALNRGLYDIEDSPNASVSAKPPVIWLRKSALEILRRPGVTFQADLKIESFDYPSVNIVGVIKGSDSVLSKEYVLFSAHQDHDGIRMPYGDDSIYNGADDNGSASVAMLAIARTFKAEPAKRSALFVWHGAEERGLLGSKWFSVHSTVPKNSIVAVLNADMIGRNHQDSAALLGSTPPHMNSYDLVKMALEANSEGPKFIIDSSWDDPAHPEGWYFRSDHLPYARAGIPALFFSSQLHPEYHTPLDEAARVNLKKLTRMTQWLYRTGWIVANKRQRPKPESNFKLER